MADRIRQVSAHASASISASPAVFHKISHIPDGAPAPMAILEFAPSEEGLDWIYLTAGMSNLPVPATDDSHRLELIMYTPRKDEQVVDLLAGLATYPFEHSVPLGAGDTIAGRPNRGVVADSQLTEILVAKPNFDRPEAGRISFADGTHAQLLWVVPISARERMLIIQQGLAIFYRAIEEQGVDVADLQRVPLA